MNISTKPVKSIEFHLTEVCNYSCPYCCEGQFNKHDYKIGHASDDIIESVYKFLEERKKPWHIKLIGGEPFTHPRFMEICETLANSGHQMSFTTNFSYSKQKLLKLLDVVGDNLDWLTASMHLTEIKDVNKFISKAEAFNIKKQKKTSFSVTSVLTETNFEKLKRIKTELNNRNIKFNFLLLKENSKFVKYPIQIQEYLKDIKGKQPINEPLLYFKSFRTKCHTGFLFFNIKPDGTVTRCYNRQFPKFMYNLGNISDSSFKPFSAPMPCLSKRCTCSVPMNRNMIEFSKKYSYMNTFYKIGTAWKN